jgi:hypothetical protein
MKALSSIGRAMLACAGLVGATCASAGPVVQQGSRYELALFQEFGAGMFKPTVTFDGAAETFVYTPLGGTAVTLTVQESQRDLGAGRAAIDVSLGFAGGDPFPLNGSSLSGIGLGVGTSGGVAGDALDLTSTVALTAALVQGVAGNGTSLSLDIFPEYQRLGFGSPWDGALISRGGPGVIAWFMDTQWGNLGLSELTLHFETQAANGVPSPGTLPLLALGLAALASKRRVRG